MIKLYLDDIRIPSKEWILVKTATDCINYLKSWKIDNLSLDHDLGENEKEVGNGYQVLLWIENQVYINNNYFPPKIVIHSSNSSAKIKMEQAIKSIEKICLQRTEKLL